MDALNKAVDKVASLLDLFDVSFFVSGVASIAATCLYLVLSKKLPFPEPTVIRVVVVIPLAYGLGIVNFAFGRWLRTRFRFRRKVAAFDAHFEAILRGHGLADDPTVAQYLARKESRGIWRLHTRFWAEVRDHPSTATSRAFLSRQWAMAAACDGLVSTAALCTGLAAIVTLEAPYPAWLSPMLLLLGTGTTYLLGREARRNQEYLTEELVATIASLRSRGVS